MQAVVKPSDKNVVEQNFCLASFLFIYFFEVLILHISHLHRCSLSIFCLPQFTQSVCDSQPLPWLNPHHGINRIDHLRHSEQLPTQIMISSTVPLVQSTFSTVQVLQIVCDKHESPCTKTHHISTNPNPVSLPNLRRSPHCLK